MAKAYKKYGECKFTVSNKNIDRMYPTIWTFPKKWRYTEAFNHRLFPISLLIINGCLMIFVPLIFNSKDALVSRIRTNILLDEKNHTSHGLLQGRKSERFQRKRSKKNSYSRWSEWSFYSFGFWAKLVSLGFLSL